MKLSKVFVVALGSAMAANPKTFNILSLNGAKYKGYMTASFVSFMEKYSYEVAKNNYCLAHRDSERVSMAELFDLVAGTETGAIIATSLVLPNTNSTSSQKNLYFADRAQKFFLDNASTLYRDK